MTWLTTVPSWVIPFLTEYAVPDNATATSSVEFGTLEDDSSPKIITGLSGSATFPGLIPDYVFDPELKPTDTGVNYDLKVKKGIGFYGVRLDIVSYDDTKLNKWTYPLVRRKFGFCTLSRGSVVASRHAIEYQNQFSFCSDVVGLAQGYSAGFGSGNLLNTVDRYALNNFHCVLSPEITLSVGFLPIWEVWAVKFFQADS